MAVVTSGGLSALVAAACCFVALPAEGLSIPVQDRNDHCREGQFWDHGTDKCESCFDICFHADGRGTLKECGLKCPGYAGYSPGESEDSGTRGHPSKEPRACDPQKDGPMGATNIALIAVTSLAFVSVTLAIVIFNRQRFFRCQAQNRSGGELEAAVSLQTAEEAFPSSGVGPGGHHQEASVDAEAVPLKTPVQESDEGYLEAREMMDAEGGNTEVKRILPSESEECATGCGNDRDCEVEPEA